MRRWLPSRNMAVRLALYFFIVNGIILLAVNMIGGAFTGRLIEKNTMYYAQDYIRSMNNELEFYMQDVDYLTISQFFDKDLTTLLGDSVSRYEMRASFDSLLTGKDFISDVFVMNNYLQVAGTSTVDNQKLLQSAIYQRIKDSDGELVAAPVGLPDFILDTAKSGQEVLYIGRKVKNMQRNQIQGEVIVTLRADRIAKIAEKHIKKYDELILILDRDSQLVYHSGTQNGAAVANHLELLAARPKPVLDQNGYLYLRAAGNRGAPLSVAAVIPKKALLKDVSTARSTLTTISFALLGVSIGFALFVSYKFLKPIVRLSWFMRNVSGETLTPYRSKEWKDEIGFLIASFNRMIVRLQQSMDHLEVERERQKKAELRALQAQINPHFIYNTLNHVRWLAKMGRSEPVFDMITSMNEILVGAFRLDQPIIPLREELGYLKQYASIQSIVHAGKFEIVYDVDEALYDRPIAKLTLQPIVENAIFHGILPKPGIGTITVEGRETPEGVRITVRDDGVGFDPDQEKQAVRKENVGMRNVDKRIKLFFGDGYGISAKSTPGEGAEVTVHLPSSVPGPGAEPH